MCNGRPLIVVGLFAIVHLKGASLLNDAVYLIHCLFFFFLLLVTERIAKSYSHKGRVFLCGDAW